MSEKQIIKIGALIFNDQRELLAVHKRGKPNNELIVPGGRKEVGETDEVALKREIHEELNAVVKDFRYFSQFEDEAIYEDAWLIKRVYYVTLSVSPTPGEEIDKLCWLDQRYQHSGYRFASILGEKILPKIFNIDTTASIYE